MNMYALLLTTNRGRQSSVLRWILKWYVRESSAAVKSLDDLLEDHAVTQMIGILAYLLPALRRFREYEER
jgi:hypothetical protein